ncbi:RNA polymerase sigma factor [Amylibacter marinus]|nr:RNA polymerase sigma factor [Amylibacter marinus]
METSDEILAERAQSGDAEAFGELVSRHYDMVFRLGYRMFGNKSGAEDLAQDVCASLAGKIMSFRAEAKFSTWLYRVAMNAAKDMLRKQHRQTKNNEVWGDIQDLNRATDQQTAEQLAWLSQAMTTLPTEQQQTLVLILSEEMTHAQAAEILGVSEGTISWRISDAKKRLRELAISEERLS